MGVRRDRKKGKWLFVLEMGVDPETGKRKQKMKRGFDSRHEAKVAYSEALSEFEKGTLINPSEIKFGDYFANEWFSWKKKNLKYQTANLYWSYYRNYINPILGQVKLNEIKPYHIQNFVNELSERLAYKSVGKVLSVVKSSLEYAVKMEMIYKNAAYHIEAPKTVEEYEEMQIWDEDQINAFLGVAREDKDYIIFDLALKTGMRLGEILALRWQDVYFDEGVLRLRKSLNKDGKVYDEDKKTFLPVKTKSSKRTINLSKSTINSLKKQKVKVNEMKLKAHKFRDFDLVVCSKFGTPRDPSSVRKKMKEISDKAELPRIRFHSLRHSHATLLLQKGVNVKVISERLGHGNISVTLDTYSHVLGSMQQEVADKLDDMFESTTKG